eukprot:gene26248-biopygen15278
MNIRHGSAVKGHIHFTPSRVSNIFSVARMVQLYRNRIKLDDNEQTPRACSLSSSFIRFQHDSTSNFSWEYSLPWARDRHEVGKRNGKGHLK